MLELFKSEGSSSALYIGSDLLLFKLTLSALVGALIAFHISNLAHIRRRRERMSVAKAQTLTCIASCLAMVFIGESLPRAFALFGIAAFLRFRNPIPSAMNAAILFVVIILGMSIGSGMIVHGLTAFAFFYVIIWLLNIFRGRSNRLLPTDESEDEFIAQATQSLKPLN